eukprot:TRINITY_DN13961_c1_g2_i1.p1 TRINITY_DN13961_c1_g2~~TRINITY_DN13961_c1_g2_i1.p1  ORF type:complete len:589 (-),score=109.23 TRINITY_DN13961_c1_g2_i1:127-1845(-)
MPSPVRPTAAAKAEGICNGKASLMANPVATHTSAICRWLEVALEQERLAAQERHGLLLADLRQLTVRLTGDVTGEVDINGCSPLASVMANGEGLKQPLPPEMAGILTPPRLSLTSSGRLDKEREDFGICASCGSCGGSSRNSATRRQLTRGSSTRTNRGGRMSFTKASKSEAESELQYVFGRLEKFVRGPGFEVIFGAMIFLNTIVMALEAQYNGVMVAVFLEHSAYPTDAKHVWGGAAQAFDALEYVFGAAFTVELVLKIVCFRCEFVYDLWNWVDTLIVASWFAVRVGRVDVVLDPMLLRCARLVRLLRLARLARTITSFDSLFLMTTSMWGSLSVLVWSIVLLAVVLMACALFLQLMVESYITDRSQPEAARLEVFRYYGTFSRTMLTMFEITLGNWIPPCRALVEHVGEVWMLFSVFHKMIIGFSVVAVINAVFIQETFNVATQDDRMLVLKKTRAINMHKAKMRRFFKHANTDGDDALNIEEFRQVMKEKDVHAWLSAMELDIQDVDDAFALLDDGDGRLTVEELVAGVGRLKGSAKAIDVMLMQRDIQDIKDAICGVHSEQDESDG